VRYLSLRLVQAILAILGASTIVFFVLHLSSDPVLLLAPQNATPADLARLRHQLGLDQPIWVQYVTFLQNLIHGNLGYSYVQNQRAIDLVLDRLPYTAELAVAALVLSLAVGVPIGMLTAVYRGTWIEQALMPIILVGQSMPSFWSGILLILLFSVHFHWLPSSGTGGIRSLILPAITLASLTMATFARMTRSSFMEQLDQEYVRTARSKGVGAGRIMVAHVLRNASIPIITVLGLETANLLGGAVITETIFAWPGIGLLTVQAIAARDFPIIQAVVLLASVIFISANLLTDLLYGVVDPRIRLSGEAAT
jgi:peptide/nickel transport system permease protein